MTLSALIFVSLFISVSLNVALASPQTGRLQPTNLSALQATATPTSTLQLGPTSTFTFSLATLDYAETTLTSPFDNTEIFFRLPENWLIQTDGLLELDLSFNFDQAEGENPTVQFGNLTIKLDDQTLQVFTIQNKTLDHYRLRIPLPAAKLATSGRTSHLISLQYEAPLLCTALNDAALVIHPTSVININYVSRPLTLDLSSYPSPFFQQGFAADRVHFILPSSFSQRDMANVLALAAKLGDLTNNRLAISTTTDLEASQLLSATTQTDNDHLIVVGQPQDNRLIPLLNGETSLPVSLHPRQMELASQGPLAVAPGQSFTYTFTITNTSAQPAGLSLIAQMPLQTQLINCTPKCQENADNHRVEWNSLDPLAPNKSLSLSLMLKASDVLTGVVEQTVTLVEAQVGPVNADTLTSTVTARTPATEQQVSEVGPEGFFFVYNGQAVAKGDGIIQEILAPGSKNQAVLIITGSNDEAVRKASQAMSSETRFPGMKGPVALVQDAVSASELKQEIVSKDEMTLADLGYADRIIRGASGSAVDYFINVPYSWQLADSATLDLYFNHSQLINYKDSGLTVLIERQPVATLALNNETATNGHVQIPLQNALKPGKANRVTVQATLSLSDKCMNPNSDLLWLTIKDNSKISLAHQEMTNARFDLNDFPSPFQLNRTLSDLLVALPDPPTNEEAEIAVDLMASLGTAAQGKTIVPAVAFGNKFTEKLANYKIIAIGRPSRQPLIQQANNQLPQPFLAGSDEIQQRLDDVTLRLPPQVNVGYVQLIPSPWNKDRAFLAVTGTSDTGVDLASRLLIGKWTLKGNLAVVTEDKVSSIDTRELTSSGVAIAVATAVPEFTLEAASTPTVTAVALSAATPVSVQLNSISQNGLAKPELVTSSRPIWLIPLVVLNGLLVIGILAFVVWRARRRKLQP